MGFYVTLYVFRVVVYGVCLFGSTVIVRVVLGLCCMDRFDVVWYVLGLLFRVMVVWLGLG